MSNSIKNNMQSFAINQALKYVEGNPEENFPKLLDMVDKFFPENWYNPVFCMRFVQGHCVRRVRFYNSIQPY